MSEKWYNHTLARGSSALLVIVAPFFVLMKAGMWIFMKYWPTLGETEVPWLLPFLSGILVWGLYSMFLTCLTRWEIGEQLLWDIIYLKAWFGTLQYQEGDSDA